MLPIQFLHSVLLEECSVGDIQYPISYAQLTGRKKETRARLLRCHKRLLHFTTFPFLFSNIKRPVSDSTRRRHISFSSTPRVSVQQMTTRGVSLAKRRGGGDGIMDKFCQRTCRVLLRRISNALRSSRDVMNRFPPPGSNNAAAARTHTKPRAEAIHMSHPADGNIFSKSLSFSFPPPFPTQQFHHLSSRRRFLSLISFKRATSFLLNLFPAPVMLFRSPHQPNSATPLKRDRLNPPPLPTPSPCYVKIRGYIHPQRHPYPSGIPLIIIYQSQCIDPVFDCHRPLSLSPRCLFTQKKTC